MTVRTRWLRKLNTARLWEKIQRRRYIWHPTPENRRKLADRRRQVAEATRVLARHPASHAQPARGIDISNLQGTVDFKRAKADGYDFVIVKAGEGDWRDPDFLAHVKAATAAKLEVGAYQFLRPRAGRTGAQEARWFIAQLQRAGLGKGDLRPALDVEVTTLDRAGTHAYVDSFITEMRDRGYSPLIYTGTWFWAPKVGEDDFNAPLWIAAYQTSEPKLPAPWKHYAIWQHSSSGHVAGVHGDVDINKTPDLADLIA